MAVVLPRDTAAQTGTISGRVVGEDGRGLPYVTVLVKGAPLGASSDREGSFTIRNVPTGTYTVVARQLGFAPNQQDNLQVTSDSTTEVNFTLGQTGCHDPAHPRSYSVAPDSILELTIAAATRGAFHYDRHRPLPWIEATLRNGGPDTVVLVMPGDGRRTPILNWIIRDQDGVPPRFMPMAYCGNRNVLTMSALWVLPPGGTRKVTLGFPFGEYQFHKGRHQVRLTYENKPGLLSGIPLGEDDCEAVRLLRESTPCKLTSNAIEVKIK